MPELPEIVALQRFLTEHAVGAVVGRIDVAAPNVLKTVDPPITALSGRTVTGAGHWGKHLGLACDGTWLVAHLSRSGWLHWRDNPSRTPPRAGKGPLALRVNLFTTAAETPAFDLTEAATTKRLAVWVAEDPTEIPGIAALGPDPLTTTESDFIERLRGTSRRLKTALTDQHLVSGIGNAYSDEILHTAKLSPFATTNALTTEHASGLYQAMQSVLTDAIARSDGQNAARLKGEKHSGLRVHARTGQPCPVCGDTIREVAYSDRSFQYCPTCQTGGKILADRRLSRLLK